MEILLALGIVGAVAYWLGKPKVPAGSAPPAGSSPPAGTTTAPPPVRPPPAPPPAPLPPGVYPAGTPGTLGVLVTLKGGDGDCYIDVYVGGRLVKTVGPRPGNSAMLGFGKGTAILIRGRSVPLVGPLTVSAFDHWEGPGVQSRQNPLAQTVLSSGFVTGHFAWLGAVG